jgi:hypothetical protein
VAPGLFGAVGLVLLVTGFQHFRARMGDPYRTFSAYYSYRWMQGGAAQLAAARVPASATLLVLGEDAPNLSLVYFDRRGLTWNPDSAHLPAPGELAQKMTAANLGYLVLRQELAHALARQHPDLPGTFQPFINTSRYVVLKRLTSAPPR